MFRLIKLLLSPKTVLGISIGAAAAWFSDPERGSERRAQAFEALRQRAPGPVADVLPASPTSSAAAPSAPEPTLWTPGGDGATAEAAAAG